MCVIIKEYVFCFDIFENKNRQVQVKNMIQMIGLYYYSILYVDILLQGYLEDVDKLIVYIFQLGVI